MGGVKQVGRSCFVVVTPESKIMLDCGINPGENQSYNAYPRIDWFNFNLEELDAIVISHAHIDHQGFLPHYLSLVIRVQYIVLSLHSFNDSIADGFC